MRRFRFRERCAGHHFTGLVLFGGLVASLSPGCSESLDAGWTGTRGLLPVDERNPILLLNDGYVDNWQGEYAVLLANNGGPKLVGIVVNTSGPWPEIDDNVAGWRALVAAARASGLRDIPEPTASIRSALVRPANGDIAATPPNRSEGARLIVAASRKYALPHRPLAVVTGGPLTDVADAYLLDPTITDRVVVVSALGTVTSTGGAMVSPNGEMDSWADTIVATQFTYVQVSAFYDQNADVPSASLAQLPDNAMGDRLASKQPNIWDWPPATDQVGVLAVGIPGFATTVERVKPTGIVAAGATAGPELAVNPKGNGWLVKAIDGSTAMTRLWRALRDPATFGR